MTNFTRLKKILFVFLFLALIIIIGYFLWRMFFASSIIPQAPSSNPATSTPGGLPGIGTGEEGSGEEITGPGRLPDGTIPDTGTNTPVGQTDPQADAPQIIADGGLTKTTPIVSSRTLDPTLSDNGTINYYNQEDGYFYKLDENGNVIKLSDKVFHKVQSVTWAPNDDKAIIEYPDGTKISYDFNTEKQVTLPSYWEDFSFSPDGEQITSKSIGLDENNRWLIVAGADASQATAIEPLGDRAGYVYPSWSPNNQIVAYYTKGVDFDRQEIFFVGLNGENFKSTIVEGRGVEATWSKDGSNLLYSAYHSRDEYKPKLWLVGASGDNIGANRQSLELNTWASKCTFASPTDVYCAVPETLEAGSGMFPELADNTKDNLYKIDLKTGSKTLIAVPDGAYNISSLIVPENQKYLYFTDKHNDMIYQMRLE